MAKYKGDPRWITARFNSGCDECGATIGKGDDAYYYPLVPCIFCKKCGQARSAEFNAAAFDEAQYSGEW